MDKIDFKKDLKHLYLPSSKTFTIVDVPPMNFLMVDGHGDPNTSPQFQEIFNALYTMAYTIKFALKPQGIEFVIPPVEGLWWMEGRDDIDLTTKDNWDWRLMIMQPEAVTMEVFERARAEAARKKDLPMLAKLRFETYHEGLSAQILYFGPYADEGPTIIRLHAFIAENGCVLEGKHHEIYLGDPRRTAPEKLRTVIRQPMRKI
jgi:hypothetical protein